MMMDSDSSSSEEHSSSECSTDSSDDDQMEEVLVGNARLELPQGMCEKREIFDEFFSSNTWNLLSESNKQHLKQFLPKFPDNDDQEKNTTLAMLFAGEQFKFTSPLDDFYDHLKAGHYRPDIAKLRYFIRKAERKESLWRHRKLKEKLSAELVESRKNLLATVNGLPPGVEPKQPKSSQINLNPISHRTKRRYFQILSNIRAKVDESGFSSDENYPEGPPLAVSRKQKRHLNTIKGSNVLNGEKIITATTAMKSNGLDLERYIAPNDNPFIVSEQSYKQLLLEHKRRRLNNCEDQDLETKGKSITDIIHRTRLNYNKKLNKLPEPKVKVKKAKKEHVQQQTQPVSEMNYSSDSDSDSVVVDLPTATASTTTMTTIAASVAPIAVAPPALSASPLKASKPPKKVTKPPPSPKPVPQIKEEEIKVEPPQPPPPPPLPTPVVVVKQQQQQIYQQPQPPAPPPTPPPQLQPQYNKPPTPPPPPPPNVFTPDLDEIDMINLPIDLNDSNIDLLDLNHHSKAELMQDTHANFLALIRDIICSTAEHRMAMSTLEERLKAWQENPITALNDWYCLADNWTSQLQSAINFLSGNCPEQPDDFVPYIEYKPSLNVYQWIGAGRDSDNLLSPLCLYWLEHRNEMKPVITIKEKEEVDLEIMDRSNDLVPPPPRCPTTWTVRRADPEEIKAYREQERKRYDNPHRAFTYRCNGYESVVGPLKGIYNPSVGNTKARGHNMLSADRPNFVTILSLVRDATARLPNGEGTRAEICELLKCSQYISSTAPDNVLQSVVSGALDRMHTQFDPCVKYDQKRKIWIYLHRNRTEEDFERLHQQYQGMNRNMKKPTKQKTPTKPKTPKPEKVKNNVKTTTESVVAEKAEPTQPKQQTSLLINQNKEQVVTVIEAEPKKPIRSRNLSQEDKEIHDAIQSLQQHPPKPQKPQNSSTQKSVVKIINQNQKSLIIPNHPVVVKQEVKPQTTTMVTQQIINPKQVNQLIRVEIPDGKELKAKSNISIKQQILQSISPQQLQNIKNVTLLRNVRHANAQQSAQPQTQTIVLTQTEEPTVNSTPEIKTETVETTTTAVPTQNIRMHTSLTLSQQQQLLQTIRQKGLTAQQQVLIRHKAPIQKQTIGGTSLLGQARVVTDGNVAKTIGQGPLVAKVLTNAAGQVISVESLLAHQKQHGSLPQGTLRVAGVKGQANIIQLAAPNKNQVAQVVASHNNFIQISNQPKLVLSSAGTTSATTTAMSSTKITGAKTQTITKFPPKMQQIINAKFITQSIDSGQKIVQPKVIIGQSQIKLANSKGGLQTGAVGTSIVTGSKPNNIRMANLNIAHLGGKPVLLASKGSTIQGQNVILQTQANTNSSGLMALTTTTMPKKNQIINQQGQQVVLAPQIKMQPQVLLSSSIKNSQVGTVSSGQILVGGHPVRLQTSTANAQRVVLASQGQGGQIVAQQILLPAGFQGAAINIKSLQGVKVIPIAQGSKGGIQARQVYVNTSSAAAMAASNIVRAVNSGVAQTSQEVAAATATTTTTSTTEQ
ncbi:PREDICTED: nuclear factor related to kappa-B-binding protein [Nicrophorus vespilloides]|uniref:Nuclear factor related to kappa-B-binding protein n=1 Tax=Nicrophorus vespilloides TaxID=110193 RepID=A0ABM1M565_NICVS|nr:PREDICTED: nuclear factor related to kappa-B-binding protein [Nicrophorus vespilloides]